MNDTTQGDAGPADEPTCEPRIDVKDLRDSRARWVESQAEWTDEEWSWFDMGPFDGGVPGMVRRVRRILDVSQRGLAALIDVSQSVVARWETGRTSPRTSMMLRLLQLAKLEATVHEKSSGEEVVPMREDGARNHGGSRFPAHTDLRAVGWWRPHRVVSTMAEYYQWQNRSRARREPRIGCNVGRRRRMLERLAFGTPDDHPATWQLVAEVEHREDVRLTLGMGRPAA